MDKHGVTAVMFKGIKTIQEALNTKVISVTSRARALGIRAECYPYSGGGS